MEMPILTIFRDMSSRKSWKKFARFACQKTSSKNARIVHKYTRFGAYCGFEVSTRPVETYRQRGTLILADYVDLETHDGEWWHPDVVETPVCSLIKAVDGDASHMWDRGRCEAFFDEESNFIPLTGKYIPGLSFWRDLGAP